jgi:hypothetical protein
MDPGPICEILARKCLIISISKCAPRNKRHKHNSEGQAANSPVFCFFAGDGESIMEITVSLDSCFFTRCGFFFGVFSARVTWVVSATQKIHR